MLFLDKYVTYNIYIYREREVYRSIQFIYIENACVRSYCAQRCVYKKKKKNRYYGCWGKDEHVPLECPPAGYDIYIRSVLFIFRRNFTRSLNNN